MGWVILRHSYNNKCFNFEHKLNTSRGADPGWSWPKDLPGYFAYNGNLIIYFSLQIHLIKWKVSWITCNLNLINIYLWICWSHLLSTLKWRCKCWSICIRDRPLKEVFRGGLGADDPLEKGFALSQAYTSSCDCWLHGYSQSDKRYFYDAAWVKCF